MNSDKSASDEDLTEPIDGDGIDTNDWPPDANFPWQLGRKDSIFGECLSLPQIERNAAGGVLAFRLGWRGRKHIWWWEVWSCPW